MRGRIAPLLFVLLCLHLPVFAQPIWIQQTSGDPALALLALPDITGDGRPELVAGRSSGTVTCLNVQGKQAPSTLWSTVLEGSILNLKALPDADADGFPEVVATPIGELSRACGRQAIRSEPCVGPWRLCSISRNW